MMHSCQNHFRCHHRCSPLVDDLELLEIPGMVEVLVGYIVLEGIGHLQGAIHGQLVMDDSEAGSSSADM